MKNSNKSILEFNFKALANLTKHAISKDQAIVEGKDYYLYLDNYPMFGGYNLVAVAVKGGGHSSFANFSSCGNRKTAKGMNSDICKFIEGIESAKKINELIKK